MQPENVGRENGNQEKTKSGCMKVRMTRLLGRRQKKVIRGRRTGQACEKANQLLKEPQSLSREPGERKRESCSLSEIWEETWRGIPAKSY